MRGRLSLVARRRWPPRKVKPLVSDPAAPTLRTIPALTCLACGCLCDDITVSVQGNRVVGAERACPVGLGWFQEEDPNAGHPTATIEGAEVSLDEALDRAAVILREARSPLIWGLTHSSVEAVGDALRLADHLGATVDLGGSELRAARRAAFVRGGAVSATLGEVKDRAEVVLFWGGHPDATHPRHGERYSIHPRGRFLTGPRTVIVVGAGAGEPVGRADVRVAVPIDRQGEALGILLARARGVALDPARVEQATGHPLAVWDDILARFAAARYSAICFGPAASWLDATGWDSALALVRAGNDHGRRCVEVDLGEPGNATGAEAVCTWQAGAPGELDFAAGFPRHLPGEATLAARLARGEVDAVLVVGLNPPADLSLVPTVRIAPGSTSADPPSTVAIATGRLGIETGGTVERVDGVMFPLRPPLAGSRPTDGAILRELVGRLTSNPIWSDCRSTGSTPEKGTGTGSFLPGASSLFLDPDLGGNRSSRSNPATWPERRGG